MTTNWRSKMPLWCLLRAFRTLSYPTSQTKTCVTQTRRTCRPIMSAGNCQQCQRIVPTRQYLSLVRPCRLLTSIRQFFLPREIRPNLYPNILTFASNSPLRPLTDLAQRCKSDSKNLQQFYSDSSFRRPGLKSTFSTVATTSYNEPSTLFKCWTERKQKSTLSYWFVKCLRNLP